MNHWLQYLVEHHWGDAASVAGLALTVLGFAATLWQVSRSRRAAVAARDAAHATRGKLAKVDAIAEFSSAIQTLDEIKRLHRESAWATLPYRYSALKRVLIAAKTADPGLTDRQRARIQSAIQHLANIEHEVELRLAGGVEAFDVPKVNRVLSRQIENLSEILTQVQNEIGR